MPIVGFFYRLVPLLLLWIFCSFSFSSPLFATPSIYISLYFCFSPSLCVHVSVNLFWEGIELLSVRINGWHRFEYHGRTTNITKISQHCSPGSSNNRTLVMKTVGHYRYWFPSSWGNFSFQQTIHTSLIGSRRRLKWICIQLKFKWISLKHTHGFVRIPLPQHTNKSTVSSINLIFSNKKFSFKIIK